MATREDSNTQTATVTTEHTLATITTDKPFQLFVDIANLAAGEYVQISAKRRVLDGGTDRVMFTAIYPWFTPEKVVALPPFLTVGQAVFTLTQLNGSSRDFPWSLETP